MLRATILLLLISGAVLLALPFVAASLYVDQRGITVPGRVFSKREDVTVHNARWQRSCEMTVEYSPPDASSVAFLKVRLPPEQYDEYRKGQPVSLRYLPAKDLPDVPMAKFLGQVHALTTARLAGQTAFSAWKLLFTPGIVALCCIFGALVALLIVWRLCRLPGFAWAVFACVLAVLAVVLVSEFPTRLPAPSSDVRSASGTVKTVELITRIFEGDHESGMEASQPMSVVGVEFLPAGRLEPVLAIDVIDANPASALKPGAVVALDYEAASPRTARLRNATRTFVERNLNGIALEGALCLLVLVGGFAVTQLLGRAWKRLLARRG